MEVEYDVEKEIENLRKKSDNILIKYSDVDGLEDILNETLSQINSKPFNILTNNIVKYVEDFDKRNIWDEMDVESLLDGNMKFIPEEFHFLKYSTILKENYPKFFRIFGFGNVIIFDHFTNFVSFNVGILSMHKENEISYLEVYRLTNDLMVFLNDFNKNISFISVNENFYKELKAIKWNKSSKKLLDKIFSVQSDIINLIINESFSDLIERIFGNYYGVLEMIAACSAIKKGRKTIENEDVICAFRTFYKLIDSDINNLLWDVVYENW